VQIRKSDYQQTQACQEARKSFTGYEERLDHVSTLEIFVICDARRIHFFGT
jgi:hypothetical protein